MRERSAHATEIFAVVAQPCPERVVDADHAKAAEANRTPNQTEVAVDGGHTGRESRPGTASNGTAVPLSHTPPSRK